MGVWVVAGGVGWWSEVVIEDKHEGYTFLSILINCSKTKKRGGWFKDDISPSVFIKEMHLLYFPFEIYWECFIKLIYILFNVHIIYFLKYFISQPTCPSFYYVTLFLLWSYVASEVGNEEFLIAV